MRTQYDRPLAPVPASRRRILYLSALVAMVAIVAAVAIWGRGAM